MPEYPFRLVRPDSDYLPKLHAKFQGPQRGSFPDSILATKGFMDMMTDERTLIFEIGEFDGVVYFTDIMLPSDVEQVDRVAQVHIYMWNPKQYRQPEIIAEIIGQFMAATKVHRVFAEIPFRNSMAVHLAEAVGFKKIGRLRQRVLYRGQWDDSWLFDVLASDVEEGVNKWPQAQQQAQERFGQPGDQQSSEQAPVS